MSRRYAERKEVITQIRDLVDEAIIDSDDDTLAKLYEVLTLESCAPVQGRFIVDDDGS